jgi:hypothetical protein
MGCDVFCKDLIGKEEKVWANDAQTCHLLRASPYLWRKLYRFLKAQKSVLTLLCKEVPG